MKRSMRTLSAALAKPHHAEAAYMRWPRVVDLRTSWSTFGGRPWDLSIRSAYNDRKHASRTPELCELWVDAFRSSHSITPSTFKVDIRYTSGIMADGTWPGHLYMISCLNFFALSLKLWTQLRRIYDLIHLTRLPSLMRERSSKYRLHTWQERSAGAGDAGLRLRCQMMKDRKRCWCWCRWFLTPAPHNASHERADDTVEKFIWDFEPGEFTSQSRMPHCVERFTEIKWEKGYIEFMFEERSGLLEDRF